MQPLVVKGAGLHNMPLDDQPVWQQARVELGAYANLDNLRLVFSFDGADSVASSFEGLLIDDIIIGFAERGEMVSYAYNDPSFTINPDSDTTDALTGAYQLELRPPRIRDIRSRPVAGTAEFRAVDPDVRHQRAACAGRRRSCRWPAAAIIDGDDVYDLGRREHADLRVRQRRMSW